MNDALKAYGKNLKEELYDFYVYGISLATEGRDPDIVDFLLFEALERLQGKLSYNDMKDLRLIKKFIHWYQAGDNDSFESLLMCVEDTMIKSKFKNWCFLCEYDPTITVEVANSLSGKDIEALRNSKTFIKEFHDKRSQN